MSDQPYQEPMEELLDEVDEYRMPLLDHLKELRTRMIRTAVAVGVACLVGLFFSDEIVQFLTAPARRAGADMVLIAPFEGVYAWLASAVLGGALLGSPVIAWETWGFIAPGLYKTERRIVAPLSISSTILFLMGAAFAYYAIFPLAFPFFFTVLDDMTATLSVISYLGSIVKMMLAFGACFQLPVAIFFLARMGHRRSPRPAALVPLRGRRHLRGRRDHHPAGRDHAGPALLALSSPCTAWAWESRGSSAPRSAIRTSPVDPNEGTAWTTGCFGYGSLIYRPAFPICRAPARRYIRGWSRRFWQGVARTTAARLSSPGRVVTVIKAPEQPNLWGMAYRVLQPPRPKSVLHRSRSPREGWLRARTTWACGFADRTVVGDHVRGGPGQPELHRRSAAAGHGASGSAKPRSQRPERGVRDPARRRPATRCRSDADPAYELEAEIQGMMHARQMRAP